jgi:hypothetical protein
MARNNYSYEKRLRELEKQKKKQLKREKKRVKNEEEGDAQADPAAQESQSGEEAVTPED